MVLIRSLEPPDSRAYQDVKMIYHFFRERMRR